MSCIVADSGPLIALAGVGLLHLPSALFGKVCITQTVLAECTQKRTREDANRILLAVSENMLFLMPDPIAPELLQSARLDEGERTALALALDLRATILADDERARRVAAELSIPVLGLCGLLLLAKRNALIPHVTTTLSEIRLHGYFIGDALLAQVSEMAGE